VSGPRNALAVWGVSALRAVELPSGMRALIVLPNTVDLIAKKKLPEDLREIAMKYATAGIEVSSLDEKGQGDFLRLTYELVAAMVKYLAVPGSTAWEQFKEIGGKPIDEGWEPVTLTPELLRDESSVDQADVEKLVLIAGRQLTPNQVTLQSRVDHGVITLADVEQGAIDTAQEGETVRDLAEFRRLAGFAAGGADGEDVRGAAVGAPRGLRSRRRVRSRRSDRA